MVIADIFRWRANQSLTLTKALKETLLSIISFIRFNDASEHECMPMYPEPDVKVIS